MKKETFVIIMNELDTFFNDTMEKMAKVGFDLNENPIIDSFDAIADAIHDEIDPDKLAHEDKYCADYGSFIYEWLYGYTEFNDICPTAESLWDYILNAYAKKEAAKYAERAMGNNLKED